MAVAALLAWGLAAVARLAMPWAGLVLLPYAVWLGVAASLADGFARTR